MLSHVSEPFAENSEESVYSKRALIRKKGCIKSFDYSCMES
jgi:hypothetical protein